MRNGSVDDSFSVPLDGEVDAITVAPDGKILVGGRFNHMVGQGSHHVLRLNPDGTIDTTFNAPFNSAVLAVGITPSSHVLLGGPSWPNERSFTRLTPSGNLDRDFTFGYRTDPVGDVLAVTAMNINSFQGGWQEWSFIGGDFTKANGVSRQYMALFGQDGILDPGFGAKLGPDAPVLAVGTWGGMFIIGGKFNNVDGSVYGKVARLDASGFPDSRFGHRNVIDDDVQTLAVQSDGSVIIGGKFRNVNGTPRGGIAKLNSSGVLDGSFSAGGGADRPVNSLAVGPDHKVIIGGNFVKVDDILRVTIARLNPNGSLDATFDAGSGADGEVYAVAVQADGNVLVGGAFTTVDGKPKAYLARLFGTIKIQLTPLSPPQIGFSFSTAEGNRYQIRATLDFKSWDILEDFNGDGTDHTYLEHDPGSVAQRFYQVLIP